MSTGDLVKKMQIQIQWVWVGPEILPLEQYLGDRGPAASRTIFWVVNV